MKKLLVTGGAGYIGSRLCHRLQKEYPGCLLDVVDNLSSGHFKLLEGVRCNFICGDLCDYDTLPKINVKYDCIFHLASNVSTTNTDQYAECKNNIEGFRNLLAAASIYKTKVVYSSSAATYGIVNEKVPLVESLPLKPANVYGFTKVCIENLAKSTSGLDWPIIGLRFFNVFGTGENFKGPMSSMIYQLATGRQTLIFDGNQRRDFVSINLVIDKLISAYENGVAGAVYNCGSGESVSFNEIVKIIQKYKQYFKVEYIPNPYSFFQEYTCSDQSLSDKFLPIKNKYNTLEEVENYIKFLINL